MATWREWMIAAAVAAILILAVHAIERDRRFLCEHLHIPTKLLLEEPETVNRMLGICGIENVRVRGAKVSGKEQEDRLNATPAGK
jgi:hypothetical protein